MPGVPPASESSAFWTTEDVLNTARVLVNDAQVSLAGQDLADNRPYTWTLLQLCYGKLQNWLEDSNIEMATYAEADVTLPQGVYSSDPMSHCRLSYTEFVDASGQRSEWPTLPIGLLEPLGVWQRLGGSIDRFLEIPQKLGGLGPWINTTYLSAWEFRENSIYFAGNPNGLELRIRFLPDFAKLVQPTNGDPPPVIRLAHCGEALAYMVAAEFAEIRNAANAPSLRMKANEQLQILSNKSAKRENQAQTRRRGYGFARKRRLWL